MARKGLPQGFRRKPNGQLEYRFTVEGGRYSVSGASVKECREKELEKREALASAGYVKNAEVTFSRYFEEWMKSREGTVRGSTQCSTASRAAHALEEIGREKVREIERRRLLMLRESLTERGLSSATVNAIMMTLKAVFRSAIVDGIIQKNPCEGIKPLRRTEPEARDTIHRALTVEEQRAFSAASEGEWYCELIRFLLLTGCRVGEALALSWADVDQKAGVLHIRRTLTRARDGSIQIGSDTKTKAGRRDIPLTPAIREELKRQRQKCMDVFGGVEPLGLVFVTMSGKRGRADVVRDAVLRACKAAGVEPIGIHGLRDTFATRAIEQGMTPQTLKAILGHSSLAMTMDLYAHVLPDTKAAEMGKITIAL